MAKLLKVFAHCRFTSCRDYLASTAEAAMIPANRPQTGGSAAVELPN